MGEVPWPVASLQSFVAPSYHMLRHPAHDIGMCADRLPGLGESVAFNGALSSGGRTALPKSWAVKSIRPPALTLNASNRIAMDEQSIAQGAEDASRISAVQPSVPCRERG
jgi:hypothetical protein